MSWGSFSPRPDVEWEGVPVRETGGGPNDRSVDGERGIVSGSLRLGTSELRSRRGIRLLGRGPPTTGTPTEVTSHPRAPVGLSSAHALPESVSPCRGNGDDGRTGRPTPNHTRCTDDPHSRVEDVPAQRGCVTERGSPRTPDPPRKYPTIPGPTLPAPSGPSSQSQPLGRPRSGSRTGRFRSLTAHPSTSSLQTPTSEAFGEDVRTTVRTVTG